MKEHYSISSHLEQGRGMQRNPVIYPVAQRCVLPVSFPVDLLKVAFFKKVRFFFQISKSQKKYSKKLKFKFQAQDSFLEYFFRRFGDLKKRNALSEKKPPLGQAESNFTK